MAGSSSDFAEGTSQHVQVRIKFGSIVMSNGARAKFHANRWAWANTEWLTTRRKLQTTAIGDAVALVVFNACESARVRSATLPTRMAQTRAKAKKPGRIDELVDRNVSLAEAFLRGGVASFVGTYWPVGDAAADLFARDFYSAILEGHSIGESLRTARKTLFSAKEADWSNYIHYGDAAFRVKYNS